MENKDKNKDIENLEEKQKSNDVLKRIIEDAERHIRKKLPNNNRKVDDEEDELNEKWHRLLKIAKIFDGAFNSLEEQIPHNKDYDDDSNDEEVKHDSEDDD